MLINFDYNDIVAQCNCDNISSSSKIITSTFRCRARNVTHLFHSGVIMPVSNVRICQCPICLQEADHPDKQLHRMINLFVGQLDEQQRRWFVAIEARKIGFGGVRLMSQITGMDEKTIRRGQEELDRELVGRPQGRVRLAGGGRPMLVKRVPE
jgi:hypothetical protein